MYSLLTQPRPAMFAHPSGDVAPQIFVAGRTSPIDCAEADEHGDYAYLHQENRSFRENPKDIRPCIEQSQKQQEEKRHADRNELPALPQSEFAHDLLSVFFPSHRC